MRPDLEMNPFLRGVIELMQAFEVSDCILLYPENGEIKGRQLQDPDSTRKDIYDKLFLMIQDGLQYIETQVNNGAKNCTDEQN
jgi:hypothetical protein